MSKLAKLVEWLENNEDDMDGPTCDAVYDKARSLLAEEAAQKPTAPAKCVSGHDGGCPWYIPGSNPPSRQEQGGKVI